MSGRYSITFPSDTFTETPTEEGVLIDTTDVLCFQLTESSAAMAVLYKSGMVSATFSGMDLNINVPETGIYFVLNQDTTPGDSMAVGVAFDVIRTLDPKFLPMEAIDQRIEEVISAALEGDY